MPDRNNLYLPNVEKNQHDYPEKKRHSWKSVSAKRAKMTGNKSRSFIL